MSQCNEILKHLEEGKSITPIDALSLFGVFRLAARISEIRNAGHEITTKSVKINNKEFASYFMPEYVEARRRKL